jgi:hypothetical protein
MDSPFLLCHHSHKNTMRILHDMFSLSTEVRAITNEDRDVIRLY